LSKENHAVTSTRRLGIVLMAVVLGAIASPEAGHVMASRGSATPAPTSDLVPGYGGPVSEQAAGKLPVPTAGGFEGSSSGESKRIEGSFVVALQPGVDVRSAAAEIARDYGGRAALVYDHVIGGFQFIGPDGAGERLATDPRVRSVQPDFEMQTAEANASVHLNAIDQPAAVSSQADGHNIRVGILDTGVSLGHSDFSGGRIDTTNSSAQCVGESGVQDTNGHGTRTTSNAVGTIGVAPLATAVVEKVFPGGSSSTSFSTVACGVNRIVALNSDGPTNTANDVQVVNASIAGSAGTGTCTDGGLRQAVCQLVNGTTGTTTKAAFFAAAGNSGGSVQAPANFPESIAVSALDCASANCSLASFSNRGSAVAIGAPGTNICSADVAQGSPGCSDPTPNSTATGTSRSSPIVAGAAADLLSVVPGLTPDQIRIALEQGGKCPLTSDQSKRAVTVNGGRTDYVCNSGSWSGDTDGVAEPFLDVNGAIGAGNFDTPPTVSFTSPTNGGTVAPSSTVSVLVTDDHNATSATLSVDGGPATAMSCPAPGTSITCTVTGPSSLGTHTLTAQGTDGASQQSTPVSITVTVCNAADCAPTVSFTSPTNGASVTPSSTVSVLVTDDHNATSATLSVDGGPAAAMSCPAPALSITCTAAGPSSLGTHTLTAQGRDGSSQLSSSVSITITVANTPPPSITERNLTSGGSTTSGTSVTTASISPTTNSLELAAIVARSTASNAVPTLSGCFTWVKVANVPITTSSPFKQLTLFRAQGTPSSSSCKLTFNFGGTTMTNFAWSVTEYANVAVGNNGGNAVRQAVPASGNSGTASATLASFGSTRNATYGATGIGNNGPVTPGSGFTELHEVQVLRNSDIETEWQPTNATTVATTFGSISWAIIGVEIAAV
jgi:hypothetical protein